MPALCKASTKAGKRCGNRSAGDSHYCHRHASHETKGNGIAATIGGILGHLVAPGLGGVLVGAGMGVLANNLKGSDMQRKTRVFISFDFDHDRTLKEFLIGQTRHPDTPFEVHDHSLKEAAPERDWKAKARTAIKRSDMVLVVVGQKTHCAPGVLAEVAMAREENIPIVQMIGYKDREYTRVPDAGHLYSWSWDNLKKLLS